MDIFALLIAALVLLAFVGLLFYIGFAYLEGVYAFIFNKPVNVHFSLIKKEVLPEQAAILRHYSYYYNKLRPNEKRIFEHRVAKFIDHYEFYGREGFEITDEVRIRIAATYIMMTFGWRKYLSKFFSKILVYPHAYESKTSGDWHKGEFNPGLGIVVFSWDDFLEGDIDTADNVHLGIHEFAHILHFEGVRGNGVSATIFARNFQNMMREVARPKNQLALKNSGYFREYAFTNSYEFVAVLLEHFFETPQDLKKRFPELCLHIERMLNQRILTNNSF